MQVIAAKFFVNLLHPVMRWKAIMGLFLLTIHLLGQCMSSPSLMLRVFDSKGRHEVWIQEHQMVLHHTNRQTHQHDLSDGLVALCALNPEGDHIIPLLPASPCADPRSLEMTEECEQQGSLCVFLAPLVLAPLLSDIHENCATHDSHPLFSHLGPWRSVRLMI
jgi:hypothetical protein